MRSIDEYHRDHSADWDKITVPLLSCGNWGGNSLHLRGNIEGFVRAASEQKWLEVHGDRHWTLFYTDYGNELQKRFFGHFLKARTPAGTGSRPSSSRSVIPARNSSSVTRTNGRWPARNGPNSTSIRRGNALTRDPVRARPTASYDALGDGLMFLTPPLEQETEITGPSAAKLFVSSSTTDADIFLVIQVFDPNGKEVVFHGALDPHTPIAQGWLRASHRKLDPKLEQALPALSHPRRKMAAQAGRGRRARHRNLADLPRHPGRLPHRPVGARQGLRLQGRERRPVCPT